MGNLTKHALSTQLLPGCMFHTRQLYLMRTSYRLNAPPALTGICLSLAMLVW